MRKTRPIGTAQAPRRIVAILSGLTLALLATTGRSQTVDADVEAVFQGLTPAERVGQLFVVPFDGPDVVDGSTIADLIDAGRVGGVVLDPSRGNFSNTGDAPEQVARLSNALQARVAAVPGAYVPLFVALAPASDGSAGTALAAGVTPLPSLMSVGATWDPDHALRIGEVLGQELAGIGVNMYFGPELDVLNEPRPGTSGDLGVRSFGGSPPWVGRFGQRFVEGVHLGSAGRVFVVPSSFPGIGGVDRSPSDEVAVVERALDQLSSVELVPFGAVTDPSGGSAALADGLQTTHARFRAIQQDPDRPFALDSGGLRYLAGQVATLAAWREGDGPIVSPSLGATAVRRYIDPDMATFNGRRVVDEALAAGNDLLLLTDFGPPAAPTADDGNVQAALDWLVERYAADETVRQSVDQACRRVLAAKLRVYGGLPRSPATIDASAASAAVGLGRERVVAVAREALTLLAPAAAPEGGVRPASPAPGDRILFVVDARPAPSCDGCPVELSPSLEALPDTVLGLYGPDGTGRVRSGDDVSAISFTDLKAWLQSRGLVAAEDTPLLVAALPADELGAVDRAIRGADWIVFAMRDSRPATAPGSDALRLFLAGGPPEAAGARLVAIALAAPYYLDTTEIAKLTAYFAVYAHAEPVLEVAIRGLFGDAPATGASPVSVPGAGYDLARRLEPDLGQAVSLELVGHDAGAPIAEGEALSLRTSVVRDGNGRGVPDGTRVTFQRYDRAEDVFLPDVAGQTEGGQATATVRADRDGELVVTASFANGLRSEPLTLAIESRGLAADMLSLPESPIAQALVRPRAPVDWGIFLLSLTLMLLVGVFFHGVDVGSRPPAQQVRLFLLSLAWGLAGYLLVAAGGLHLGSLPGGAAIWPERWNVAYQAAVLSFGLALLPVVPTLVRAVRAAMPGRWRRGPGRETRRR